jgi:hypothetical protein
VSSGRRTRRRSASGAATRAPSPRPTTRSRAYVPSERHVERARSTPRARANAAPASASAPAATAEVARGICAPSVAGDVGHPQRDGRRRREGALHEVRRLRRLRDRALRPRCRASLADVDAPRRAHQPGGPLATHAVPGLGEVLVHARRAVRRVRMAVTRRNAPEQLGITPRARRGLALLPCVVAAPRDLTDATPLWGTRPGAPSRTRTDVKLTAPVAVAENDPAPPDDRLRGAGAWIRTACHADSRSVTAASEAVALAHPPAAMDRRHTGGGFISSWRLGG